MRIHRFFTKKVQGFSLIEILVAISIFAFSFIGLVSTGQTFLRMTEISTRETQANFLLEEGVEVVRAFRDNAWVNISGLTAGTSYYLSFSGGYFATTTSPTKIDNRFYRKFVVADVTRDSTTDDIASSGTTYADTGTRKITFTVAWATGQGTSTKIAMVYLTDI